MLGLKTIYRNQFWARFYERFLLFNFSFAIVNGIMILRTKICSSMILKQFLFLLSRKYFLKCTLFILYNILIFRSSWYFSVTWPGDMTHIMTPLDNNLHASTYLFILFFQKAIWVTTRRFSMVILYYSGFRVKLIF